jgi:hypothetical protein
MVPFKHQELIQQAKRQIQLADHMAYVTYPMVQETKFLLSVLGHVVDSARLALQAILEFEFAYKRIDAYNKTFAGEITMYKNKVQNRYNLDSRYLLLLQKLHELEKFDKESPVRFKRGDKYILSTREYDVSVLDIETVKKYSLLAKRFVAKIDSVIAEQENVKAF